jgi:hypothetical protein
MNYHLFWERGDTSDSQQKYDDSKRYMLSSNESIGQVVNPYEWDSYTKKFALIRSIEEFPKLCGFCKNNPVWSPKSLDTRTKLNGGNSRVTSNQADGSNTAPLAQSLASKNLVLKNVKKRTNPNRGNWATARGEARATREEENLESEAQPWQSPKQPSSSSTAQHGYLG